MPKKNKANKLKTGTEKDSKKLTEFKKLQQGLAPQFQKLFADNKAPRTVVVIPSLTMDQEIIAKVSGISHYEERMLCMLVLLRMPRTKVVFVSSEPIDPVIIDYYLHLLPGITGYHATQRLTLLSCHDGSARSLTEKILERPRLIERIKSLVEDVSTTHMACFTVSEYERELALQLGIPIFGCDPELADLGSKSNGRKIFRECGFNIPDGYEDLHTDHDIAEALGALKQKYPSIKKAVVKINDGASGDGNALFYFDKLKGKKELAKQILEQLPSGLKMVADDVSYEFFMEKYGAMGGIVECFVEGKIKTSPSVQCRVMPDKSVEVLSTHDQELGGDTGQIFLGAQFPASREYAVKLGEMGAKVGAAFAKRGVLGRFAVDFISVKEGKRWLHYPIEINLRKGGTTHPYMMLQFLTNGRYVPEEGIYKTFNGDLVRYYFCSDNLQQPAYKGITPHDLVDIAMMHELHFDGTMQEGIMFHMIGALSRYGKLGAVCVGSTPARARAYYDRLVAVMDQESANKNRG